jgi:hypothetical protein
MERDLPVLTNLLTSTGRLCEARAVAVWEPVEDQLHLVADWRLDQPLIDLLRSAWREFERELRAGRRVTLPPDVLLLPLLSRDGTLLGVLQYVGAPLPVGPRQSLLDETAQDVQELLATTLPPAARTQRMLPLLAVDLDGEPDTLTRRTYGALVERCGGDVSAAAAMLAMARSMFYDRMDACGWLRWKPRKRADESGG